MISHLKALTKTTGMLLLTLPLMPVQAAMIRFYPRGAKKLPIWYHRNILRILGVRLQVKGNFSDDHALLIVSNHVSWMDISILSALAPVSFVAKAQINDWPLFGSLARLQRTVFVQREKRSSSHVSANEILDHLEQGNNIVLFPEGTSTDGNSTLCFKSSLFAAVKPGKAALGKSSSTNDKNIPKVTNANNAATIKPLAVQTISLAYTRIGGLPIGRQRRHQIAWVGDHAFAAHAWQVLRQQPLQVCIEIGDPVDLNNFNDRKSLCTHTEREIKNNLAYLLCYEFGGPKRTTSLKSQKKTG